MNKLFFFHNFLENNELYDQNELWWEYNIRALLMPYYIEYQTYIHPRFRNGRKFYNGNPIFNALVLRQKRAIKIIQENPLETERIPITAWITSINFEDNTMINELNISLILTQETAKKAQLWIEQWLIHGLNLTEMNQLLAQEIKVAA